MKKKLLKLLCLTITLLVAISFTTACAAASDDVNLWRGRNATQALEADMFVMPPAPSDANDFAIDFEVMYSADDMPMPEAEAIAEDSGFLATAAGAMPITAPQTEGLAEKIIYSVNTTVETLRFEESINQINALMVSHGGFIESSSISGINYSAQIHGWNQLRSAWFSIRVPVENLDAIVGSLGTIGNITHLGTHATNITSQFVDTQSRLNSLTIQEERLLDMLSNAGELSDLILLEARLSEVRFEIEWLTTSLRNMQAQVDFSTLTISLNEVEQLTEPTPTHRTFWQQIGDGFISSIRAVGNFILSALVWIASHFAILVIIAAVAVATVFIIKRIIKKDKAKRDGI